MKRKKNPEELAGITQGGKFRKGQGRAHVSREKKKGKTRETRSSGKDKRKVEIRNYKNFTEFCQRVRGIRGEGGRSKSDGHV